MNAFRSQYRWFLCVLVFSVSISPIGEIAAMAQDAGASGRLERVEIEPPRSRPPSRARAPREPAYDYDEPTRSDRTSSDDRSSLSRIFSGEGIPSSTRSLVTEKSQVSLQGASLPGQVSVITSQDLQRLNIQTYSDLFRRIPGLRALNYGQGDIGASLSMRGFRSNNGSEVCIYVDGVPQNFPSMAAGIAGTSELYWLTPEIIEKIEIVKGPFSAFYGDWALGGSINIITKKSEPSPSVRAYGGSFGTFRPLAIISSETLPVIPFLSYEFYTTDGYKDNSQITRFSPFNKISVPFRGGILSLRYNYHRSVSGDPGYISIADVRRNLVSRRAAVNMDDGSERSRHELVLNYAPACGERGLYTDLYFGHFDRKRWYTWSFPSTGQADNRLYWGGRVYYNLVFGDVASLAVGGETRQDSGPSRQFKHNKRQWLSSQFDYGLRLSNWAWFLQGQIKPAESLKLVGGVRGDYFRIHVDNEMRPENSGTGFPSIVCPKVGFVITPTGNFNIFGNLGTGFRSPGAREVSSYSAGTNKNFLLKPARLDSADVGLNVTLFGNLYFGADYYHTINTNEIRTVDGQPKNIGDTLRKGYEFETKFYASPDVNVFANYAWVDARVTNPTRPGQDLVPSISEHVIKGGIEVQRAFGLGRRVIADAYYQYNSGAPNYNGSNPVPIMSPDFCVYNFKLEYEGRGWSSFAAAQYRPREFSAEYATLRSGDPVFIPQAEWETYAGLTYTFW